MVDVKYIISYKLKDYLKNRAVEEQSQQLDEVKQYVSIFLLHSNDVWQSKWPLSIDASVGWRGPGEETELEKVLDHNSQLRKTIEGK